MSGIAGIYNLNGAAVEPAELRLMVSAFERRGPDGAAIWHEGPVGFACSVDEGV